MKKLLVTLTTLTAIGVAVKVVREKNVSSIEIGNESVKVKAPIIKLDGFTHLI